ncbi:MAG: DinB family protein [Melioribacteraceae bacterium]|nr:DinB family protein [Melioribacteraceae bacterium]
MKKPAQDEYSSFYSGYINSLPETDILKLIADQKTELIAISNNINEEKSKYRYAANKWSIRELIGHLIDCERIFSYRILRFSRGDLQNELPGFDENVYIAKSKYHETEFGKLVEELILLRSATVIQLQSLTEEEVNFWGVANKNKITVRALIYIIAGHTNHHISILKERYL